MPMPPYEVRCYAPKCKQLACFKIAARWSDGVTKELKTYFLACADCREKLHRLAIKKKNACRLTAGESLSDPEVFELTRGRRDHELMTQLPTSNTN